MFVYATCKAVIGGTAENGFGRTIFWIYYDFYSLPGPFLG